MCSAAFKKCPPLTRFFSLSCVLLSRRPAKEGFFDRLIFIRRIPERLIFVRLILMGIMTGATVSLEAQAVPTEQEISTSDCRRAVTPAYSIKRLTDLDLSPREIQALRRSGIDTVKNLLKKTAVELQRLYGLGNKRVQKIEEALAVHGLSLPQDSIMALGIPPQTANTLYKLGIHSLEELLSKTESDLWRLPHLGRRTIPEIKTALKANGLSLARDPFMDFGFSLGEADLFYQSGLRSPVDLVEKTEVELWKLPKFRKLSSTATEKIRAKIKKTLESHGLSLAEDPLMSLGLPFRIALRLNRAGIHSIRDLRRKTEADLSLIPGMGKISIQKIRKALQSPVSDLPSPANNLPSSASDLPPSTQAPEKQETPIQPV